MCAFRIHRVKKGSENLYEGKFSVELMDISLLCSRVKELPVKESTSCLIKMY